MSDTKDYYLEYPKTLIVKGHIINGVINAIKDKYKVIETTDYEKNEDILLISSREKEVIN